MHYLFAVIDRQTNAATQDEMIAIDAFNERLDAAGRHIMAVGLVAPRDAQLVDNRDGQGLVTKGPLNDTPEYMSGFWVVDAPDEATALDLALEASEACNRRVEVRRLLP